VDVIIYDSKKALDLVEKVLLTMEKVIQSSTSDLSACSTPTVRLRGKVNKLYILFKMPLLVHGEL